MDVYISTYIYVQIGFRLAERILSEAGKLFDSVAWSVGDPVRHASLRHVTGILGCGFRVGFTNRPLSSSFLWFIFRTL